MFREMFLPITGQHNQCKVSVQCSVFLGTFTKQTVSEIEASERILEIPEQERHDSYNWGGVRTSYCSAFILIELCAFCCEIKKEDLDRDKMKLKTAIDIIQMKQSFFVQGFNRFLVQYNRYEMHFARGVIQNMKRLKVL